MLYCDFLSLTHADIAVFGALTRPPLNETIICSVVWSVIDICLWLIDDHSGSPDVLYVNDKIYSKDAVDKICPWLKTEQRRLNKQKLNVVRPLIFRCDNS